MAPTVKRFYREVSLLPQGEAWQIALDGKAAKTPGGRIVATPHRRLAEAIAEEWRTQADKIDFGAMPLTRLAMSVSDHVLPWMAGMQADALNYAETDLLCYRADSPERLAERQARIWQPFLDWAARDLQAPLVVTTGIAAVEQNEASLAALRGALAVLDPHRLLVAQALTARFGSLVLALAVIAGKASAREAFEASRLDEIFQAEIWGLDAEAEKRAMVIRREVEDLARFLALLD